jgi:predicted DNA-binding protein with PD1-like motif
MEQSGMRSRLVHEADGQRTFVVVLETGDEVMSVLKRFAGEQRLTAAQITAIGAFRDAVISYFDWEQKTYLKIPVKEQVEVASMIGDVATDVDGSPALHVHLVLGRRDGSALAGHLAEAHVRPTLEVIITESPAHLCKVKDGRVRLRAPRRSGAPIELGHDELAMAERLGGGQAPARGADHHIDQRVARFVDRHVAAQDAGHVDVDVLAHGAQRARVGADLDDRQDRVADDVPLPGRKRMHDVAAGRHQRHALGGGG